MSNTRVGRALRALRWIEPRQLALSAEACAICGARVQVRLAARDVAVRCLACGASAVAQSLVAVLRAHVPRIAACDALELSARGPVLDFLAAHARSVVGTEFLDGVAPGASRDGVRCEDVQALSFADASFGLATSTEVFEHVEDDAAAFAELHRVLRPGGLAVFTVPLSDAATTVERTALRDGRRVPVLPPEIHGDPLRPDGILCLRNYGRDIVDRLRGAGFAHAELVRPASALLGQARTVVVARRE
jgi:SAM-dependent methyltransferase